MKSGHVFVVASLGVALGMALATGCGSSTTGGTPDAAAGDGAGSSSSSGAGSSGSSGGGSGGGSGSSGSSGGGSGSSSGAANVDAGPLTRANDCPNCPGTQICCLSGTGTNITGTCAANAAACPTGAAPVDCGQATDCPGQTCCVNTPSGGGPSSITCQTTCAGAPACGGAPGDNIDCPGDGSGTGWACVPVAGTPSALAGKCVAVDGGAPPGDSGTDGRAPDSGTDTGTPPADAAADGG